MAVKDAQAGLSPATDLHLQTAFFPRSLPNIGQDTGLSLAGAVLGGDDPGRGVWAPAGYS